MLYIYLTKINNYKNKKNKKCSDFYWKTKEKQSIK